MKSLICAAVLLVTPNIAAACNPVALVAPQVYAAPIVAQQFVAPVYQPVVAAVEVQQVAYAAPVVVQQQVVVKQRVRRHPLRRAAQVVLPPYGGRQRLNVQVGGCCH